MKNATTATTAVRETMRSVYGEGWVAYFAVLVDGIAFTVSIASDDLVTASGTARTGGHFVNVATSAAGDVTVMSSRLPSRSPVRTKIAKAWPKAVAAARAQA
jgi:hypothetical protein